MRAMVISRFGGPDVFELQDRPRPVAGPGELLVRVVASGTNPVDAKIRQAGSWAGIPFPAVLGYDVSGVVEEVGPGVTGFKAGDEVFYTPEIFGNPNGSYAEYTVAAASIVAHKPAGLSHVEAAGIPLAGGTAWEAIVRRLAVRPGETVLIHGGAGGVGSFAIQFAKAAGARVLATASKANHEAMRDLGADVTLDYRDTDVVDQILREAGGAGVDAAFDTAGGNVPMSTQVTRPFGRIATILPPTGDLNALYVKNQTLYGTFLTREGARLREMAPLFVRGQAKVIVDAVLPLEEVGKAHERLDSGHGRGKIILQVGAWREVGPGFRRTVAVYIWLIGLHVTAVTLWILGMSAAAILISALDPTTAAEEGPARLLRAAARWERRVTSPAMGLAWLLGITLVVVGGWGFEPWLVAKVIIVTALSALHGKLAAGLRRLGEPGARPVSPLLRFSPLAVIAGAIAIVTLVVVKPY